MPAASPITIPDEVRTSLLVATIYEKKAEIARLEAELADLESSLIERGKGSYEDAQGRTATVVIPSPAKSLTLYPASALKELCEELKVDATVQVVRSFRKAREEQARGLAGDAFLDLFDFVPEYKPREGFASRADALLTPARARGLVAMCTTIKPAGKPYLKLTSK